jgi:exodeoxyribonuclease VII small subunit
MPTEQKSSYESIKSRLDEIVTQVQKQDTPLEASLDLYDEALRLGNRCVELLDSTDFSIAELQEADAEDSRAQDEEAQTGEDASGTAESARPDEQVAEDTQEPA